MQNKDRLAKIEELLDRLALEREQFQKELEALKALSKENLERIQALGEQMKETDRRMKETDERMKETDRRMKETDERMKETDRRMKETDERMKETDRRMKETDKRVAKVTDAMGYFVEYTAAPALPKVFKPRGIKVSRIYQEAEAQRNGQFMEIDVIGVGKKRSGEEILLVVELKSQVRPEDIKKLSEKLEKFTKFFPEYKSYLRVGVIGGIKVPKDVQVHAEREGFYVLVPSGETMKLANKKGFQPKVFRN